MRLLSCVNRMPSTPDGANWAWALEQREKSKASSNGDDCRFDSIFEILKACFYLMFGFCCPGIFAVIYCIAAVILLIAGITVFYVIDANSGDIYRHIDVCFSKSPPNNQTETAGRNTSLMEVRNSNNSQTGSTSSAGCTVFLFGVSTAILCGAALLHFLCKKYVCKNTNEK